MTSASTTTLVKPAAEESNRVQVGYRTGEEYEVTVRGHRFTVDQPIEHGGADTAPTPTELFVASLTACVAFYAGRYLDRNGWSRDGLTVEASFTMADRPARVGAVTIRIHPPAGLPPERIERLLAVASHCTVHNSLTQAPDVTVAVAEP